MRSLLQLSTATKPAPSLLGGLGICVRFGDMLVCSYAPKSPEQTWNHEEAATR